MPRSRSPASRARMAAVASTDTWDDFVNRALAVPADVQLTAMQRWAIEGPGGPFHTVAATQQVSGRCQFTDVRTRLPPMSSLVRCPVSTLTAVAGRAFIIADGPPELVPNWRRYSRLLMGPIRPADPVIERQVSADVATAEIELDTVPILEDTQASADIASTDTEPDTDSSIDTVELHGRIRRLRSACLVSQLLMCHDILRRSFRKWYAVTDDANLFWFRIRWSMATGIRGPCLPQPEWLEIIAGIAEGHEHYNDVCHYALFVWSDRYWLRFILGTWAQAAEDAGGDRMWAGHSIALALRASVEVLAEL